MKAKHLMQFLASLALLLTLFGPVAGVRQAAAAPEECDIRAMYGVTIVGANEAARLYSISPLTGNPTKIGAIGFNHVTAIAFNAAGVLYGTGQRADGSGTPVLITIDRCTGAGTEVAPLDLPGFNAAGLSFRPSDGVLFYFGYNPGSRFKLGTIDTTTGHVVVIGGDQTNCCGNGIAFWSDDTLYHSFANQARQSVLNTMDTTTGVYTAIAPITWPSDLLARFPRFDGLVFLPGTNLKILYGALNNGVTQGGSTNHQNFVATVNTDTGYVRIPGRGQKTVNALTSIAFYPVQPAYSDVPPGHWAADWVNAMTVLQVTDGCNDSGTLYCPDAAVTRDMMAVLLVQSTHGPRFVPPAATGIFTDVPISHWAAAYIEQLYYDGVTSGCNTSPLMYCPSSAITRAEMSVFLLRAKNGATFTPPAPTGTMFTDVPASHWAAAWIERLASEGITGGCAPGLYCPNSSTTRAQMAVFLVRAFVAPLQAPN